MNCYLCEKEIIQRPGQEFKLLCEKGGPITVCEECYEPHPTGRQGGEVSQSMMQLADIKPGHPIWDEVWERSRPGGISHLSQLFEAKIENAKLRADNKALLDALKGIYADGKP